MKPKSLPFWLTVIVLTLTTELASAGFFGATDAPSDQTSPATTPKTAAVSATPTTTPAAIFLRQFHTAPAPAKEPTRRVKLNW